MANLAKRNRKITWKGKRARYSLSSRIRTSASLPAVAISLPHSKSGRTPPPSLSLSCQLLKIKAGVACKALRRRMEIDDQGIFWAIPNQDPLKPLEQLLMAIWVL